MLRVKGANSDGVWNPDVRTLGIRILPPFYLSVWAYLIYILLILGTFFALFFYQSLMMSFPKGVKANPASLKCCSPKGIPIMVMHSTTPNAR
mgnify:FL=1